ncbi:MAG: hypothetical protein IJ743_02250 [Bacilli bacterium]|nr:hypothetical protein [Bacilli bacterium]MBR1748600.1 hypothetical protein [Bacilli bacterium]
MNNYLIPANTKKSKLILGFFTPIDLAIFGTGCLITVVLLFLFQGMNLSTAILVLLPALISGFLVVPVPNYHNVLQLITNIVTFFLNRKRYYWKGWCIHNGEE